MRKLTSVKHQLIFFLSLFAIYLVVINKDPKFLLTTIIAIASSIASDSILQYIKTKKFIITTSSVITGLIIGFVLSSDQPWWVFLAASLLAICSKHLIRMKQRHLFNPAAFGIFLVMVLINAKTQWKGAYLWYILIPVGLYFIYRIRKMELLIGYVVIALLLFGIQATIQKLSLTNIFWYLNYFFIFIMIIEPKTTPIKPLGKALFGISAGGLIFILTEVGVRFDVELCSLLLCNFATPLFNKLPIKKGGK